VLEGRRSRADALARYAAFSESHRWKYACLLQAQHAVPRLGPRALGAVTRAFERGGVSHRAFGHYLRIAPPEFALPAPGVAAASSPRAAAA
jgi:digeranylgeranylglycerophospholipid reductase